MSYLIFLVCDDRVQWLIGIRCKVMSVRSSCLAFILTLLLQCQRELVFTLEYHFLSVVHRGLCGSQSADLDGIGLPLLLEVVVWILSCKSVTLRTSTSHISK
jgi:hypothetical protein